MVIPKYEIKKKKYRQGFRNYHNKTLHGPAKPCVINDKYQNKTSGRSLVVSKIFLSLPQGL